MEIIGLRAYHIRQPLNLDHVRALSKGKVIQDTTSDILYRPDADGYIYATHYGSMAFYNCSLSLIDSTLKDLASVLGLHQKNFIKDDYGITLDEKSEIEINFHHVTVNRTDLEIIKILLLNLAQSVAISHYDHISQELNSKIRLYTMEMETNGKLTISEKNILKMIGKAFHTQNQIAENIYIYDAPYITWVDEFYNALHNKLASHFELSRRFQSIENTLKISETNLQSFLEVKHHSESSRLEWIIIVLILVEVADHFIMKLL